MKKRERERRGWARKDARIRGDEKRKNGRGLAHLDDVDDEAHTGVLRLNVVRQRHEGVVPAWMRRRNRGRRGSRRTSRTRTRRDARELHATHRWTIQNNTSATSAKFGVRKFSTCAAQDDAREGKGGGESGLAAASQRFAVAHLARTHRNGPRVPQRPHHLREVCAIAAGGGNADRGVVRLAAAGREGARGRTVEITTARDGEA